MVANTNLQVMEIGISFSHCKSIHLVLTKRAGGQKETRVG